MTTLSNSQFRIIALSTMVLLLLASAFDPKYLSHTELAGFWLQVAILSLFSTALASLGNRFHIPDLVVIIAVAIGLGPNSPFGFLTFKSDELAWLAVIFKVLGTGASVNLSRAIERWREVLLAGSLSFLFPFLFVILFACLHGFGLFRYLGLFTAEFYSFDFFLVCALSFAVAPLALVDNILDAANLRRTPYGTLVTSYQALNEVITWTIFAVIVSHFEGQAIRPVAILEKGGLIVCLSLLIAFAAQSYGKHISNFLERRSVTRSQISATVIIGCLIISSFLDGIVHGGIVMALLIGVALASIPYAASMFQSSGLSFVKYVCLPIFFYQAFVDVNIAESFSLEVFLFIFVGGMVPSYFGVLASAISPTINLIYAHRMAVAASTIGISSLVVVQFLLPSGAPGKAELLSGLALAIPISSFLGAGFLQLSYRRRRKTNLNLSFKRGGLRLVTPVNQRGFTVETIKVEDELVKLFCEICRKGHFTENEALLLNSVAQASHHFTLADGRDCALFSLPLPTKAGQLRLYTIMSTRGILELSGKDVALALVLAYPSDDRAIIDKFTSTFTLFKNILEVDNHAILRRLMAAKEEKNPAESIGATLEVADAMISFRDF